MSRVILELLLLGYGVSWGTFFDRICHHFNPNSNRNPHTSASAILHCRRPRAHIHSKKKTQANKQTTKTGSLSLLAFSIDRLIVDLFLLDLLHSMQSNPCF